MVHLSEEGENSGTPNDTPATRSADHTKSDQEARIARRILLVIVTLLISSVFPALIWLRSREQIPDEAFVGIGLVTGAVALSATLLKYLGDDYQLAALRIAKRFAGVDFSGELEQSRRVTYRLGEDDLQRLVRRVRATSPRAQAAVSLTEADRAEIVAAVSSEVRPHISQEFLEGIEAKYSAASANRTHLLEIRSLGERTKERLLDEVVALSRRSNLNLVIGIVTTVAAVGLLGYIVLSSDIQVADWHKLVPSYILRLSLVVFIEIFAFFFLRMYRVNLQEIKYFQNEMTSIEAKLIALEAALASGDSDSVKAMIAQLGNVERNQILQQGQSTSELERLKLENSTLKELITAVGKLVPGTSSSSK